jgi:alpha-tubulin suppressor-like RCC1 family protein
MSAPDKPLAPALVLALVALPACSAQPPSAAASPTSAVVAIPAPTEAPATVDPPTFVTSHLAAGSRHTCAIDAASRVRCWGANDHGQLGDGTRTARATPVLVSAIASAVDLGAAGDRTCALTPEGDVFCWGDTDDHDALVPGRVDSLRAAAAISVEPGRLCAVLRDGTAACRGSRWLGDGVEEHGAVIVTAPVTGIADAVSIAGSCVLTRAGYVRCWGRNAGGEVGDGTTAPRPIPVPVRNVRAVVQLAAGSGHTCALRASGEVACWGSADRGQAGTGAPEQRRLVPDTIPSIRDARSISAAEATTCAVLSNGKVTCWGGGVLGSLNEGMPGPTEMLWDGRVPSLAPALVPELDGAASVAVGGGHACARLASGALRCWGENLDGQLGTGVAGSEGGLVTVRGLTDVVRVAAGGLHTCALQKSGAVQCWGAGRTGELGDGALKIRAAPAPVAGLTDAVDLSSDGDYTCAVRAKGTVVCWGASIPMVEEEERPENDIWKTPVEIADVRGAQRIFAGHNRVCARLSSRRVACWGDDSFSALGIGAPPRGHGLLPVPGLAAAESVAVAPFGACATTSAGALWCWGAGTVTAWEPTGPGNAGHLDQDAIVKPVRVSSVRDAAGVGVISLQGCMLRRSGRVACWDAETRALAPSLPFSEKDEVAGLTDAVALQEDLVLRATGEIGTINTGPEGGPRWRFDPDPHGITDATTIARGNDHTCVSRRNGQVACWGSDATGQLGAGARGRSDRPLPVVGFP